MLLEELAVVPSSMAVCARRIVMPLLAGIVALTHATVAVAQEEAPREATPEPPKRDEKSPVKVTPLGYVEAYYTLTLGGTAWF
ncbi:MAG: hypothetical protein JWP87_5479 [Labilithrix sp.]|nr:hypothetical protein [Labilithrix sp.]